MIVCLDTNAYSLLERKHQPLCECVDKAEKVIIPVIVMGELFAGFEIGSRRDKNIDSMDRFLSLPGIETVSPSRSVAERYGIIVKTLREQGTPIPTNDIWIAATALETGARLVSYDNHFQHVPGLIVLCP